jgi:uncharacterized protein (DUF2236 family)
VTRERLELRLEALRREVPDPREGLFGPGSLLWEVNRSSICFLGAGRAALLQLAHPWVAQGIEQHSATRDDPFGRFRRTFFHVFRMVFGDLPAAFDAARAVHAIHERVAGTLPHAVGPFAAGSPYRANDPAALLWVHATLWDTSLLCFERVVRPLADDERQRYYGETKRFAALFGLGPGELPEDWPAFREYVGRMLASDALSVTPPAASMGRFLFRAPVPGAAGAMRRYAELTAWLLPERLAAGFGLERGAEAGRLRVEAAFGRLRRLWPRLPRRARLLPAYVDARRRLAGRAGPDPVGRVLNRLLVGSARPL